MRVRRVIIGFAATAGTAITAFALSGANLVAVAAGHISPLVYFHS
jgi:hypothetical protein